MLKQQKIFFDFLRFSIGSAKEIPGSLKEVDWKELYAIAKKQCLVGVLSDGIKKLPAEHVRIKRSCSNRWRTIKDLCQFLWDGTARGRKSIV
jgi:hypothetical protein